MSGNLIDLRRSIKSVKDTQKTTRAMKTVSAAKMRRSVTELNNTRPVMGKIQTLLSRLAPAVDASTQPLLAERPTGNVVLVVVSADKGLCGAFNSKLIAAAEKHFDLLSEETVADGHSVHLVTIGNKANKYFTKRQYEIKNDFRSVMSRLRAADAMNLAQYLLDLYLNENSYIKRIEFLHMKYISASRQEIAVSQMFPIRQEWKDTAAKPLKPEDEIEYIFEPSEEEIFKYLLPRYINSLVYQVLLQSAAAEHMARMVAMETASQNASDMIKSLTLTMNKLRQASITTEILEIITATEALKK